MRRTEKTIMGLSDATTCDHSNARLFLTQTMSKASRSGWLEQRWWWWWSTDLKHQVKKRGMSRIVRRSKGKTLCLTRDLILSKTHQGLFQYLTLSYLIATMISTHKDFRKMQWISTRTLITPMIMSVSYGTTKQRRGKLSHSGNPPEHLLGML